MAPPLLPTTNVTVRQQGARACVVRSLPPIMLLLAATSLPVGAKTTPPLMIQPDTAIRVAGKGCRPHANVVVILGESKLRKHRLVTFPADGSGSFSSMVNIPFAGEGEWSSVVVAECANAAGNTITAFETAVTYVHPAKGEEW